MKFTAVKIDSNLHAQLRAIQRGAKIRKRRDSTFLVPALSDMVDQAVREKIKDFAIRFNPPMGNK